jgi:hypothetical protein
MRGAATPGPNVRTATERCELARVGDRTFYARVRIRSVTGFGGVQCASVTPFAIVMEDSLGEHEFPLPDTASANDLGELLELLLSPL